MERLPIRTYTLNIYRISGGRWVVSGQDDDGKYFYLAARGVWYTDYTHAKHFTSATNAGRAIDKLLNDRGL